MNQQRQQSLPPSPPGAQSQMGATPTGAQAEWEQSLQRSVPEPLHKQISDRMRKNITTGVWPSHYKLRAEPDLASDFEVSRGTVRRALRTLIEEGLLVQVHGKGTFVPSKMIEPPIAQELLSLAEGLAQLGVEFETHVRDSKVTSPPSRVQALLDLDLDAKVFQLERTRSIEGVAVAFLVNYVRVDFCPGIEAYNFTDRTLFGVIEGEYHQRLASGRRTFEAQAASRDISEVLQVPEGSPILYLEQVAYIADGRPIEYSDVWIRGDRLKLSSVLTRL